MARPASRSRRREEALPARRGRGAPSRPPQGPPMGIILAGVAGAAVLGIVVYVASKPKPAAAPQPAPVALAPVKKAEPPPPPPPPKKAPPKPLTPEERAYIDGLFRKAEPHVAAFRKHAKAGWDLKGQEDNDGANEEWIDAKHEFQKAVQTVSEALEDEERFPEDRPGMRAYIDKLVSWQKEYAQLPKVNVTR